jgi:hypothetical protein
VSPKAQLRGIAGLVALGLIKYTPGHASPDPAHGRAARFGILYRATRNSPADERWRRFKTTAEVKETLARVRAGIEARKRAQRPTKSNAIVVPFGNHCTVGQKGNHSRREKREPLRQGKREPLSTLSGERRRTQRGERGPT